MTPSSIKRKFFQVVFMGLVFTLLISSCSTPEKQDTGSTLSGSGELDYPGNWNNFWGENIRKVHFDLHTPGDVVDLGKDFDPVDFAEKLEYAGADAAVFFCRGGRGFAYHYTEFNEQHPHLKTDMFGEVAVELDKRGLGVIGYFHCTPLTAADAASHPDWMSVDLSGETRYEAAKRRNSVCPSSTFWEESFIPQMQEVVQKYPVGAIWVDGIYHFFGEPCFCERCMNLYGRDLPDENNSHDWRPFYKFLQELVWDKMNMCAQALEDIDTNLVFGSDWVGSPMWSYPEPEKFGFNTADIRFDNGPLNAGFAFAPWTWRRKPADINMQREYWWQEFNTRSIYDIQREFAATLASCGSFMLGDVFRPYDMRIEDEKARFFKDAFEGTAKLEDVVRGARPFAEVAMLYSPEQQRMKGRSWSVGSPDAGNEDPHYGVYTAIAEAGFNTHILYDADLKDNLYRYKTLIIPEIDLIGPDAEEAIEEYVSKGGNIILIGKVPAVMDAYAEYSKEVAEDRSFFEKLAGIRVQGTFDYEKTFFIPLNNKLAEIWPADVYKLPVGVWGEATKAELDGAEMIAALAAPGPNVQGGIPMGEELGNPAFSVNSYGEGKVFFIAQPLASQYMRIGHRGVGCALQSIISYATPELFAVRKGGSMVQLYVTEKKKQTAFHLVSYATDIRTNKPKSLQQPAYLQGITVEINTDRTIGSAWSVQTGKELKVSREAGKSIITAPPFQLWESVVVNWK
ncbi:beta-galactosidase trimerization domain-containing protein [Bacteroidota bacterium]